MCFVTREGEHMNASHETVHAPNEEPCRERRRPPQVAGTGEAEGGKYPHKESAGKRAMHDHQQVEEC